MGGCDSGCDKRGVEAAEEGGFGGRLEEEEELHT